MNENVKAIQNIQAYFKDNNISSGFSIPTSGTYTKGDIVVNKGETQNVEPMWLCIESGTPGKWIVVGKDSSIGELSELLTDNKSSVVAAINETLGKINDIGANINGALTVNITEQNKIVDLFY